MCGIVGYVGPRNVVPIVVGGLERLEYRGYDSAGIAVVEDREFHLVRSEGKLVRLKKLLEEQGRFERDISGPQIGIGHTRWATHGRPSETNAHPHIAGDVCVVHNGIIENYAELKAQLQKEGAAFRSDTDTEIAAHLVNRYVSEGKSLLDAVRLSVDVLRGSYALVVISKRDPASIVVAKNSTPVVLGYGEGENFIASDIPAILQHTRKMLILEDGEIAEIRADRILVEKDRKPVERAPVAITWDAITAEKGGFRHFMLKEIYEQPQVVTQTFRGRIDPANGRVFLDGVSFTEEELNQVDRICLVACGTAMHAALVTKFYLEKFVGLPVEVDYGSEFRYRVSTVNDRTLFIVISQSGETADTLGSLVKATEANARTMAICNVVDSSIARKSGNVLYTHAGPEISVASTKAFVTQLVGGYLMALYLGQLRNTLNADELKEHFENLLKLPAILDDAIKLDKTIERVARKYGKSENFLFLGRGFLYPIALEGALKLKEISYVHAEGYPAGEMKHGPISLVGEETPVVVVIGHDGVNYEKTISNMKEVEARGGRIIAVTDRQTPELQESAWEMLSLGDVPQPLLPIALTVPLQLLAYHVAVYRGTDIDQPRNLAKSVTVE